MNTEKQKIIISLQIPFLLVGIMLAVKLLEFNLNTDFGNYGIYPRTFNGLIGIVFSPFLHGDWEHLFSNLPAIVVLGSLMLYFYPTIAKVSMMGIGFFTGIAVWLFARNSYHIGASGLVYGFAFFLFFSAVFRKDIRSLAISLFVILFYGGIIWGLLPLSGGVSWETHIAGALFGTVLAYFGRKADVVEKITLEDEPGKPTTISYKEFIDNKDPLEN